MDHLCFLCLVFLMLLHLFIAAMWSPAGKGLFSWLLLVMFFVSLLLSHVVSFVWYLIVSFPDLCRRSYFEVIECLTNLTSDQSTTVYHSYKK